MAFYNIFLKRVSFYKDLKGLKGILRDSTGSKMIFGSHYIYDDFIYKQLEGTNCIKRRTVYKTHPRPSNSSNISVEATR